MPLRHLRTVVAPLVAAAMLVPAVLAAQAQDDAATGVLGTPVDTACVTDVGATQAPEGALTYAIASEESVARYRAREELASVGATEAVGATQAIVGTVLLAADGTPLPCSRFDVDLRTLTSDEARRDNYLYDNTLETGQYPLATFILTSIEGVGGPLVDGEETTLTLVGNLTMHGQTQLVAWEATVALDGDALTGSATTSFDMADFGIEEPVVGPVVSVDERIELEVELVARAAA